MQREVDIKPIAGMILEQQVAHLRATLTISTNHRAMLLHVWGAARDVVQAARSDATPERKREVLDALERWVKEADPGRVVWPGVEDLTGREEGRAERADPPAAAASGNGHQIADEGGELFDEEEQHPAPQEPEEPGAVAVSHCSAEECKAPILWLRNERTHRASPIDARPALGGNVVVDTVAGTYRIASEEERHTLAGQLHYNHFATCPAAKNYTRKAGRGIA